MTIELNLPPSIRFSTPEEARIRADRIKIGIDGIWTWIEEAYGARDWEALGYSSWDEYCTCEFGTSRLRLPREERQEVVASLRDAGLSTRAIAAATGTAQDTVRRDLAATERDRSLGPVMGVNGKTYAPPQRSLEQQEERRRADEHRDAHALVTRILTLTIPSITKPGWIDAWAQNLEPSPPGIPDRLRQAADILTTLAERLER